MPQANSKANIRPITADPAARNDDTSGFYAGGYGMARAARTSSAQQFHCACGSSTARPAAGIDLVAHLAVRGAKGGDYGGLAA